MATEEPTTIRINEIQAVADRLRAYGLSKTLGHPGMQRDMVLGSKVIRALARSFSSGDVVSIENGNTGT